METIKAKNSNNAVRIERKKDYTGVFFGWIDKGNIDGEFRVNGHNGYKTYKSELTASKKVMAYLQAN